MITPSFGLTATERVLPKLALDFTTGVLDPRVAVTRALNTATTVNSSGYIAGVNADTARFNYDPITLACKGLLSEDARTNIILQSEDFGTTWTLSGVSLSTNNVNGPDNNLTADKLTATATTAVISQAVTKAASAITYTGSIFVKGDADAFAISIDDGTATNRGRVIMNLNTGTLTSVFTDGNFTNVSGSVEPYANGFYRLIVTATSNTTTTIRMRPFYGSTGKIVYLWGAQLEVGAYASSYIATTTTGVLRNADVVTAAGQGVVAQGAFVTDATVANGSTLLTSGGVTFAATSSTAQKIAVAYDNSDVKKSIDAGTVTTLAGATASTNITIGTGGIFRKVNFYTPKLIDAELQAFSK